MLSPRRTYWYLRGMDKYCYGVGIADLGSQREFLPEPCSGWQQTWSPVKLQMQLGAYGNLVRGFPDWIPSNISARGVLSTKLRTIIDFNRGSRDVLQWLLFHVFNEDMSDMREYYFLHFPSAPRILDPASSQYVGKGEARSLFTPVFFAEELSRYEVCTYDGASNVRPPIVSDQLRRAIIDAGCTAVKFEPVLLA